MKIEDNKVYTCPECDSEHICVTMFCSVHPNAQDVDVDWESDVGDSDKWSCDDCGHTGFLPNVESLDDDEEETMVCDLCGAVEDETDAISSGWLPDYYDGEDYHADPVCPDCCASKITTNEDGDNFLIKVAH